MNQKRNDIGTLIGKKISLEEQKIPFDAAAEWSAIKPAVQKVNFLKWKPGTFNLYYLLGGLLTATLFTAALLSRSIDAPVVDTKRVSVESVTDFKETNASGLAVVKKGQSSFNRENKNVSTSVPSPSEEKAPHQALPASPDDTLQRSSVPVPATVAVETPEIKPEETAKPENQKETEKAAIHTLDLRKKNYPDTIIKTDTLRKVKTKKTYK